MQNKIVENATVLAEDPKQRSCKTTLALPLGAYSVGPPVLQRSTHSHAFTRPGAHNLGASERGPLDLQRSTHSHASTRPGAYSLGAYSLGPPNLICVPRSLAFTPLGAHSLGAYSLEPPDSEPFPHLTRLRSTGGLQLGAYTFPATRLGTTETPHWSVQDHRTLESERCLRKDGKQTT